MLQLSRRRRRSGVAGCAAFSAGTLAVAARVMGGGGGDGAMAKVARTDHSERSAAGPEGSFDSGPVGCAQGEWPEVRRASPALREREARYLPASSRSTSH